MAQTVQVELAIQVAADELTDTLFVFYDDGTWDYVE